jgi:hypothetical protein
VNFGEVALQYRRAHARRRRTISRFRPSSASTRTGAFAVDTSSLQSESRRGRSTAFTTADLRASPPFHGICETEVTPSHPLRGSTNQDQRCVRPWRGRQIKTELQRPSEGGDESRSDMGRPLEGVNKSKQSCRGPPRGSTNQDQRWGGPPRGATNQNRIAGALRRGRRIKIRDA